MAAAAAMAASAAFGEAKEQKLVFSGYSGTTTLTDFQAMVKLTEGQYGFSYNDYAANDGSDLWFTDSSGNVIPHEIDLWNVSGTSYIWVRVPELAGKSTSITMHWGEARTAAQTSTANVWKNNKDGRGGYVGVWHMGKATGAQNEPDATGNGLDAVPYSESSSVNDMTNELNAGWPTGANRCNTTTSGHKNALKVPDYSKKITDESRFTVSGWFRCTGPYNGNYKRFFSSTGLDGASVGNGWQVRQNGDGWNSNNDTRHQTIAVSAYNGSSYADYNTKKLNVKYTYNNVYITVVFSDRIATIYQNGVLIGSDDIVGCKARQSYLTAEQLANPVNDFGFLIGLNQGTGNSWVGFYDEVRMYDGAEAADRVKANYDTMNTPNTFLAMPAAATGTAKSALLKFAGYTGNETLTNFQALVKLSEGQYGFSYDDWSVKDGSDIWFEDAGGNVIPHEIDTWDASGDSFIWVRVPELSGPDTSITMHWGAERTAAQKSAANVWKNNGDGKGGYVGVWHMGKAVLGESEPDSTGNGLHAAPYSETGHLTKMVKTEVSLSAFPTAGRQNAEADGENNALKVPLYKQFITDESRFTVSGWFRCSNAFNTIYKRFFSATGLDGANVNNGWTVRQNGDYRSGAENQHKTLALSTYDGTTQHDYQQHDLAETYLFKPVYITVAFDGTKGYVYENGALQFSEDIAACKARESYLTAEQLANPLNAFGFTIGCGYGMGTTGRSWVGYYDEIRMYDGAESAARIKANYDTMKTPNDFLVADNSITTAEWTGAGNDGDVSNSDNWVCRTRIGDVVADALPRGETDVTISGANLYIDISAGTTLLCKSITFGNSALARTNDWTGLAWSKVSFAEGAAVDLNGYGLVLSGFGGSGTITNSVDATTALLTLNAADAVNNTGTAIGGNIKLAKEGAGAFTSSKALTYTGGTEIKAGTIQAPQSTAAYDATFTPFGTGRITVNSNAVFNAQSTAAYRNNVILNGGTVTGGAGNSGSRPVVMLERVTADSAINQSRAAIDIGEAGVTTDLNGHTVNVTIAGGTYFRWYGSLEGVEGKIVVGGSGYFEDLPGNSELVDVEVNGAVFNFGHAVYCRDFTANNGNNVYAGGTRNGLYVSGTFTPVVASFYGCVLQDGATFNISSKTLAFSISSSLGNQYNGTAEGNFNRKTVRFEAGAKVTVKLPAAYNEAAALKAAALAETKVLSWDDSNSPDGSVEFLLEPELSNRGCEFVPKGDGLYLAVKRGFTIRISENEDKKVTVPGEWVAQNYADFGAAGESDIATWLGGTGANGLPRWQGWLLGLDPADASSVVLCRAAETQPGAGEFAVGANVNVQAGSGAAVTAYLDTSSDGEAWTEKVAEQALSDGGTVSFSRSLASGECGFYRIRLAVQ